MENIDKLPVNDGKGLYDNQGLCDTIANDLNDLIKTVINGNFIRGSAIVYNMTQKLANLKKGIAADLESKDQIIEELKRINDELVSQKTGLPVERGDNLGND